MPQGDLAPEKRDPIYSIGARAVASSSYQRGRGFKGLYHDQQLVPSNVRNCLSISWPGVRRFACSSFRHPRGVAHYAASWRSAEIMSSADFSTAVVRVMATLMDGVASDRDR